MVCKANKAHLRNPISSLECCPGLACGWCVSFEACYCTVTSSSDPVATTTGSPSAGRREGGGGGGGGEEGAVPSFTLYGVSQGSYNSRWVRMTQKWTHQYV